MFLIVILHRRIFTAQRASFVIPLVRWIVYGQPMGSHNCERMRFCLKNMPVETVPDFSLTLYIRKYSSIFLWDYGVPRGLLVKLSW